MASGHRTAEDAPSPSTSTSTRRMRRTFRVACAFGAAIAVVAVPSWAAPERDPTRAAEFGPAADADRVNLERNLRWMLVRERAAGRATKPATGADAAAPVVGLYADAGAWHEGVRATAAALESEGCRVKTLDYSRVTKADLDGLAAVVLPGGWAPFQRDAIGAEGLAALRAYVEAGGRVLGICAGAYLISREVRWEGEDIPYPLGLFDGRAAGPIDGLAPWPRRSPVKLAVTADGKRRGLGAADAKDVLYYGGARFEGGTDTTVLARYPDGGAAIVERRVGKGAAVLCAVHFERPAGANGAETDPPPALAGPVLRALVGR